MTSGAPKPQRRWVDGFPTNGRDVDTDVAELSGEAAGQLARAPDQHLEKIASPPWPELPEISAPEKTYYGRPVLKAPVWSLDIPIYYFLGGTAGAALTLAAAMQLAPGHAERRQQFRALSAQCHWLGILGSTAGAAFLIHDLGRPSRFLNMLRVFRPSSPMNMGSWILAVAGPTAVTTGLLINHRGILGAAGKVSGCVSGVMGAALAAYTGVLVSNTVVPIWRESRHWMPILFVGSAAASAASMLDLLYREEAAGRVTRIFGTAGRMIELAAARRVEIAVSATPRVALPFRHGTSGFCWKAARALTAGSVAVSFLPLKAQRKRRLAGILGAAGSLCLRLAVHYLGNASASDAKATFQQQRRQRALADMRS
jgi:formate-dependent nitrite reductase membrane component NrfD